MRKMTEFTRKHLLIFATVWMIGSCCAQHLDEESLDELDSRGSEDKRYPHCMRGHDNNRNILWCDKSRYEQVSEITYGEDTDGERINRIQSEIEVLYINNSRVQRFNPGDLSNFTQLIAFIAENNFLLLLKSNTFRGNSALEKIDISRNKIRTIENDAFAGLPQLSDLNLSFNHIESISWNLFRGLRRLEQLYLEANNIQVIPKRVFKELGQLKTLILKGNRISSIHRYGLDALESLEVLDLSNNNIKEFVPKTFEPLRHLRKLYLRGNQIKEFPNDFKLYTLQLEVLDLGSNHFQDFANDTFTSLKQLRTLEIDQNSLTHIRETTFEANENLEFLNLSANALEIVSPNAFLRNRNLTTLLLRSNHLRKPEIGWFQNFGPLDKANVEIDLHDNDWWCDCTTKAFENYMITTRETNREFSTQLDIHCRSNKEFTGRLSNLDIFCPADGSPIKPAQLAATVLSTATLSTKVKLMKDNVHDMHEPETMYRPTSPKFAASVTSLRTLKSQVTVGLPLSSLTKLQAVHGRQDSAESDGISVLTILIISGIAVVVVAGISFIIWKKSRKSSLKTIFRSSRRKRQSSSQPFLEDNQLYGRPLSEPFSGSEEDVFTATALSEPKHQTMTPQLNEEDKFYTPYTTPKIATRECHGDL